MNHKKQILVLEEAGVPKGTLPFEMVTEEKAAISDQVEGIITIKKKVGADLLAKYPNVKFIAVAFTGYDCVDLEVCRKKNIAVFNVPTYATHSVAELAVGLAISLLRGIPAGDHLVRSGGWMMRPGRELHGKTVGILGTGVIGMKTAELFRVFGCRILGWSRGKKESFKKIGEYIDDLDEFFSRVDIVSVHLPLTNETKGMVGAKELAAMRKDAHLINTARGPIVDEKALIKALQDKKIAGVALDVFDQEPIISDHPLLKLSNVILTPHIAYKTQEALKRRAEVTANNILDFLADKETNRV